TWTKESQHPEMGGRRVALPRYGENLDWMAREAAARGVGVAFVGPCNLGMVDGKFPEGASWAVFFDAQAKVAAHHGVPWIPTLDAMRAAGGADPAALFVDVMHPSPAGHAVFAAAVDEGLAAAGWPGDRLLAAGGPYPFDQLVDSGFGYGHTNPTSPQRNLFGDVRVAGPPPAEDPRAKHTDNPGGNEGPAGAGNGGAHGGGNGAGPGAGGGSGAGPTAGGGNGAPGASVGLPKWSVAGSVERGAAPFVVEARGNGATVASARLAAAGTFALNVRGDLAAVEIVVTDAAGAVARNTVARGESAGVLTPR
ncbi:MAG: SGNH/GDSL hydrolase family protein, partial [Myxococcota bacterium]